MVKAGLFYAAARLMKVLTQANRQSGGAWPRKRVYLYGYFFEEFLGLGLPADYAVQSAFNSMAVGLSTGQGEKSDLGAAMSDSALAGLGALGDYSSLGDSSGRVPVAFRCTAREWARPQSQGPTRVITRAGNWRGSTARVKK